MTHDYAFNFLTHLMTFDDIMINLMALGDEMLTTLMTLGEDILMTLITLVKVL
jgi:hypothetical protein